MTPFDEKGAFLFPAESSGLRRLALRGAGVTVIAQGLTFLVQMVSTMVLARLLTPADFGVVTMVTTISILLVNCSQIGIPDAVLQREEIDHFLISNVFWINVSISFVLTVVFAAFGSVIAKFYHDPHVAGVAAGVSLSIILTSTSALHLALLKRAMRFLAVSVNSIISRIFSIVVSIILAWRGWGYWALVAGTVAQPLAASIGAWMMCRWTPSLPRHHTGTSSIVRFARNVFGRYSFNYFSQNTDNLLVGWRFGPYSLGLYKKAYDLFVLPFSLLQIYPVAVSALSRLTRNPDQYRRYFLTGLSMLMLLGAGLGADLTLIGKDVVRVLLGPQWDEAGRIFMFFGPGIAGMLIYGTHGIIHLSIGTTARHFRWVIVEFVATVVFFVMGLPWGPAGVATAWSVSYWALIIPGFWYAGRPISLGVTPIFRSVWRFIVASILAAFSSYALISRIPFMVDAVGPMGSLIRIAVTSFLFGVLYVAAVIILHRGCSPIYQLAGLLREMLPVNIARTPSADQGNSGSYVPETSIPKTLEETIKS